MELQRPITFCQPETKVEENVPKLFNSSFFSGSNNELSNVPIAQDDVKTGKKRGRPAKKKLSDGTEVILADEDSSSQPLPIYQTNQSYLDTYTETTGLLKGSVMQIDMLQNELKQEIDTIRNSKTLKRKYDYISTLTGTVGTLIGTKVTAIREMNKVITDSHNLDLKRLKDLKMDAKANEVDDNKRIMDMYEAFINTPVGSYSGPNILSSPSIADLTSNISIGAPTQASSGIVRVGMAEKDPYIEYSQNMSPSQNMMRLEQNPDIKTVVVYDASTSNRWFDVINLRTGESVPNVNKPDSMFLEDTSIDVRNGVARNAKLDITYPLIQVGNSNMSEY